MQYFGGKQRISGKLLNVIQPYVDTYGGIYWEPFVGGASVLCKVKGVERRASDINEALITMWKALQNGWNPPDFVSEALYTEISAKRSPEDPLTAFVGFGCSFAGKWFGGYARGDAGRNYAANAKRSLEKKMRGLEGVDFLHGDYREFEFGSGVIYCDPPYKGTTQYAAPPFVWRAFWSWCRERAKGGATILVSEYAAPEDIKEILSIETKTDIRTKQGHEKRAERLFCISP